MWIFFFKADLVSSLVECTWTLEKVLVGKNSCSWQKLPSKTDSSQPSLHSRKRHIWHFYVLCDVFTNTILSDPIFPSGVKQDISGQSMAPKSNPKQCETWPIRPNTTSSLPVYHFMYEIAKNVLQIHQILDECTHNCTKIIYNIIHMWIHHSNNCHQFGFLWKFEIILKIATYCQARMLWQVQKSRTFSYIVWMNVKPHP